MDVPASIDLTRQSLCARCETLYNSYDFLALNERIPDTGKHIVSLGKLTARTECALCNLFFEQSPSYKRNHRQHVRLFDRIRQTHLNQKRVDAKSFLPARFLTVLRENSRLEYDYLLEDEITHAGVVVYLPYKQTSPPLLNFIDPSNANWELLGSLISNCQKAHSLCNQVEHRYSLSHIYLINCIDETIVREHPSQRYLALSYVWGRQSSLETPESLMSSASWPENNFSFDKAPLTIQDAIRAVRNLGKKYLWVDRYCINQRGDQEKMMMLRNMDQIYENAEATLVALYGESDSAGLPGVSRIPRKPQPQLHSTHGRLVSSWPPISVLIQKSKWATRGWTYQEARLSRRCLFFTECQIYFVCLETTGSEAVPSDSTSNLISSLLNSTCLGPALFGSTKSLLKEFCLDRLVFTQRQLTYESDVLDAFRGILNRSKVMSFWGVPITPPKAAMDAHTGFSLGLLWTRKPKRATSNHLKSPKDPPRVRRIGFPSWSWMSVTGEIFNENGPGSSANSVRSKETSVFDKYLAGDESVSKMSGAFIRFHVQTDGQWEPLHDAIQKQCTNTLREESPNLLVEGDLVRVVRSPSTDRYRISGHSDLAIEFSAAFDLDLDMATHPLHDYSQHVTSKEDVQDALILVEWNDSQRKTRIRFVLMLLVWDKFARAERRGLLSEYRKQYSAEDIKSIPRTRKTFILH